MANKFTNRQAAKSTERFYTTDGAGRLDWGDLLSTKDYDGFQVLKVFSATCSGHCYGAGGPADWLTVMDGEVMGVEPTKRRAKLIGDAIVGGHIEKTGDTGGRLDSYLCGMAVWDYEGVAPTEEQKREIRTILNG
jgi:hypothetical protein